PRPPFSTLFPYTTLFRSVGGLAGNNAGTIAESTSAGTVDGGETQNGVGGLVGGNGGAISGSDASGAVNGVALYGVGGLAGSNYRDRKSTRLNSSHLVISY